MTTPTIGDSDDVLIAHPMQISWSADPIEATTNPIGIGAIRACIDAPAHIGKLQRGFDHARSVKDTHGCRRALEA